MKVVISIHPIYWTFSFNLTEAYLHVLVHLMTIIASHFHKNTITLLSDTDD